jgi:hypothetical protein
MNHLPISADSSWLVQAGAATILVLHIVGGIGGIVAGAFAMAYRKGGPRHALAGNIFFVSMLVMGSIGGFVAPFLVSRQGDPKWLDSTMGFFTCYLVATSWLTVRRRAGTIGRSETAAFAFAALLAAACVLNGMRAAGSANGLLGGVPAGAYYVLAFLIALAAGSDLRLILQRGTRGPARITRHLWRMCAAWFIATGSFFLGQQRVMPEWMRGSPVLTILGLAPLAFLLFWLVRVRLGKRLRAAIDALGERSIAGPAAGIEG